MTEVKKETTPNPDIQNSNITDRRIVVHEGGSTAEQLTTAVEDYKAAKAQFDKVRAENDIKSKELVERIEDEPETGLAAEPSSKEGTAVSYEMKSGEGTPNITYNLLPGQEAPEDAVKKNYAAKAPEKSKTQEEIALDNKMELEKKAILNALTKKHDAEINDAIKKIGFDSLDDITKKSIHADALSASVDSSTFTESDKKEALKGYIPLDGKLDLNSLNTEQLEIVQKYRAKTYLDSLSQTPDDIKDDANKLKNYLSELEKKHPGITEFVGKNRIELLDEDKFFAAAKEDPSLLAEAVQSIKEDGFVVSGIDPQSELGKALTTVIHGNVDEYLELTKGEEEGTNEEDFKGLRDILGGGYKDLLYADEQFLLGEDHSLKNARDGIIRNFVETATQRDGNSPTYQAEVLKDFSDATGLNGQNELQNITRIAKFGSLSPMARFLADLFAPFGALFPAPTGDFWRSYLNDTSNGPSIASRNAQNFYGEGQSSPIEGMKNGVDAEPGSIHAAARKYVGISESGNPDMVRKFHQSGGSAVKGAGTGTAWCMSFVQHVCRVDMGLGDEDLGKATAWARDGHKIGRHVNNKDAKPGDIVLVHSSAANSGRHIGFVDSMNPDGSVNILGGNQGNAVSVKKYSASSIAEIRRIQKTPTSPTGQESQPTATSSQE